MKTIHIETLGCRLNQIESEAAAQIFIQNHFEVSMQGLSATTQVDENVKVCILNTCAVTQKAEQKARRIIRLLLKTFPYSVVIVTGCYAQLSSEEISLMNKRIFVLPGQIKSRLAGVPVILMDSMKGEWNPELFLQKLKKINEKEQNKKDTPENSFVLSATSFLAHSRASLKIQDGCNSCCSYCAIHMARGHSVSVDVQTALSRVKELEEKNYDEVVLTTVNISQYRSEYNGEVINFSKLLKILLENTSKINFRISSLYPQIVNDEFCGVIKNTRVRPHFHISVQTGSNKILSLMNRNYKAQAVIDACNMLRKAKDTPFLACDIITGFPGESDEDFNQTLALCRECDFAWIHAFPYSERPGTVAVTLKNKVPQSVSGDRAKKITNLAIENKIKYIEQFCNKPLSAILETKKSSILQGTGNGEFIYHCMTENFIHCEIRSNKVYELNKTITIKIQVVFSERIKKGGEIEAGAIIVE